MAVERTIRVGGDLSPDQIRERETSVGDRFRAMARLHPELVAIESASGRITYAELDDRSERAAAGIVARLGTAAEPVGLLIADSAEFVVGLLAVLKAGKPAAPLMGGEPDAVLARMLDGAGVRLVLSDGSPGRDLGVAEGVALSALPVVPAAEPPTVDPGATALVLHTSGSGGEPKGVARSHRCELHQALTCGEYLGFGPGVRHGMLVPTAFAAAYFAIYGALLYGGTLLPFDTRALGLGRAPAWMAENDIHVTAMVATMLPPLASAAGAAGLPSVRHLIVGGERVTGAAARHADALLPVGATGWQLYASTEAALAALNPLSDGLRVADEEPVPIRTSVPGITLAVDDAGEIIASGAYMADGYWRQPSATAGVFSVDSRSGTRTFRTGDHGILDDNGGLVVVGREDRRVKIRGHRVEVHAIERALTALAGVTDAAVVAQQRGDGRARLVAFVVTDPDAVVSPLHLKRSLARTLPTMAIPSRVVAVPELPTLPSGKRDLRALRTVSLPRQATSVPASGRLQTSLAALWQEVLDLEEVGAEDSFFDLGGDSLDVVDMLVAAEQRFGAPAPVGMFVNDPTIRGLARLISERPSPPPISPGSPAALEATGPRLFLATGMAATWLRSLHISSALAPDLGVYTFDPVGSGGGPHPLDIGAIADHYLEAMRDLQPEGPYWLCGFSFGCMVVAEMAARLERAGAAVAGIVLVDGPPGEQPGRPIPRFRSVPSGPPAGSSPRRRLAFHRQRIRVLSFRGYLRWLRLPARVGHAVDRTVWTYDVRRGRTVRPSRRTAYVWHHNRVAALRHRPSPVTAPILVIRAARNPIADPALGWSRFARGTCKGVAIDRSHGDLLGASGAELTANAIRGFVDDVTSANGAPA